MNENSISHQKHGIVDYIATVSEGLRAERGIVSNFSTSASSDGTVDTQTQDFENVTFTKEFGGTPSVIVSINNKTGHVGLVANVDTTGFTAVVNNYSTTGRSNIDFYWVAVGPK